MREKLHREIWEGTQKPMVIYVILDRMFYF